MNAPNIILFVAGLMAYIRFAHPYVAELFRKNEGSVQPWHNLHETFEEDCALYIQERKTAALPTVIVESEVLPALPTDPLAIALLKSTLTLDQVLAIRVEQPVGTFRGEILEELPKAASSILETTEVLEYDDDTVALSIHD